MSVVREERPEHRHPQPTGKADSPPPIFIVSGGVGTSGEQVVRTVLAQFPGVEVPVVVVPYVHQMADVEQVVEQAVATGGTIVHTLVDASLRRALTKRAAEREVPAIDLMGPLLDHLTGVLGIQPLGKPGLYRRQREAYFERVEAIEFTVAHDDGQRPEELSQAEIVLVGVSRVGKTPLSIYLSTLGWKVANVPLIPGISPPPQLFEIDRRRVIGLTIEPGQLIAHRQWRQRHLGIPYSSAYSDPGRLYEELEAAHLFFRRLGCAVIDITDKPIEASAEEVIALMRRRTEAE